ncbi:MAG: hypothetical protein LBP62_04060 [Clostridiales bacterium]|jgi:hypothetical protein|nr:hypothetical protein [Clostridiales bacterium]
MKNRIKLKNKKELNTAVIAAAALLFCAAVFTVVFYRESSPTGAAISAAVILFAGGFLVFSAFYSFYAFGESVLSIRFGFFTQKIPFAYMRLIREDKSNGDLYLVYLKNDDLNDVRIIKILIAATENAGFTAAVRQKNRLVIYELFDKNEEFNDG